MAKHSFMDRLGERWGGIFMKKQTTGSEEPHATHFEKDATTKVSTETNEKSPALGTQVFGLRENYPGAGVVRESYIGGPKSLRPIKKKGSTNRLDDLIGQAESERNLLADNPKDPAKRVEMEL